MATLREAQKKMTRQRLLEEGLAAFAEQGYSATTIDDIATRVGATRATFYLHFSSKAELVRALVERTNEMLVSTDKPPLTEVVASGDRAVLKAWLGRKFDQWPEIKDHITVSHQAAAVEPDIQDSIDTWFDDAIGNMQAGLDAGPAFRRRKPTHPLLDCLRRAGIRLPPLDAPGLDRGPRHSLGDHDRILVPLAL